MRTWAPVTSIGILVALVSLMGAVRAEPPATSPAGKASEAAVAARAAAQQGLLVFRLTTPDELKKLLGEPLRQHTEKDGDGKPLIYDYTQVQVVFARHNDNVPYVLFRVLVNGESIDIGENRPLKLRDIEDLKRLDTFWGLANVSAAGLDLSDLGPRLNTLPFDNRTQWPAAEKLPEGFEPAKILEAGKNPGLGVRKLHAQGIDGRGVHIAIIDQPLLRDHREYKERVVEYVPIEVEGAEPQMHGSPVTSIAVGKSCGTAPGAAVHYYAVPTWKWWNEHCKPYAATVDRIVERNKKLPAEQKVRVISISLGAFSGWPDRELWEKAVQRAANEGVIVISCDPAAGPINILKRRLDKDPESADGYGKQLMFRGGEGLGVPAGNRTTAEHSGKDDYVFWRDGGMSWTVPYLAGVAALAYQVDPDVKPQKIRELWMATAKNTAAGKVIDPVAFIEAVKGKR